MRKTTSYRVLCGNQPKGEAYRSRGRWVWLRPNGSKETYGPRATIEDVRDHVARVCNCRGAGAVRFKEIHPPSCGCPACVAEADAILAGALERPCTILGRKT